jgi:hypothetical protein
MLLLSLRRAIYLAYVLILLHETCLTAPANAGVERQQPQASEGLLLLLLTTAPTMIIEKLLPNIRTVQSLLDHKDVRTTMIYTHVLKSISAIESPLDFE